MRYPRRCLSQTGMWGRAVKSTSRPSRSHMLKRKASGRSGHGEISDGHLQEGKRLGRRPALWRRHDIYALDDSSAKVEAEECYRDHATRLTLTSFSLYSGSGRFICEFPTKVD